MTLLPVPGDGSCHRSVSQPPHSPSTCPSPFIGSLVSYSGSTESQRHICHCTSSLVTHQPLCPSLHIPYSTPASWPPFPGNSLPALTSLALRMEKPDNKVCSILKQHPPFPLRVSHLILQGIAARFPAWEMQNRALFMAAQRPARHHIAPFCFSHNSM